jgi:hypothetical protein
MVCILKCDFSEKFRAVEVRLRQVDRRPAEEVHRLAAVSALVEVALEHSRLL